MINFTNIWNGFLAFMEAKEGKFIEHLIEDLKTAKNLTNI